MSEKGLCPRKASLVQVMEEGQELTGPGGSLGAGGWTYLGGTYWQLEGSQSLYQGQIVNSTVLILGKVGHHCVPPAD